MSVPRSVYFQSQRLRLHYWDWGNEAAPSLVLLHGGEDHARSLDALAEGLRGAFHVVAPDLRGHGDSAWTSDGVYAAPCFVLDLANLLDTLGAARAVLVGHSFGGAIALRYAGIFPERVSALAAIEGVGHTPPKLRAKLDRPPEILWAEWVAEQQVLAAKAPRYYQTLAEAAARMRAVNPHLSQELALHLVTTGLRRHSDGSFSWKFDPAMRSFLPVDIGDAERRALWARITCPVLLAHGGQSWASDPADDGNAGCFADARVVHFPDAGHWLHHDEPAVFLAALRTFLLNENNA